MFKPLLAKLLLTCIYKRNYCEDLQARTTRQENALKKAGGGFNPYLHKVNAPSAYVLLCTGVGP